MTAPVSRRQALTGAAVTGIGLPLLAACGSSSDGSGGSSGSGSSAPSQKAGTGLVATSDVPVGGGVVLSDEQLVVTQPKQGEFKGFSAICTHAQCLVGSVSNGVISCPCHGSQYSIEDGSVLGGPAPSPLPSVPVKVEGTEVVSG